MDAPQDLSTHDAVVAGLSAERTARQLGIVARLQRLAVLLLFLGSAGEDLFAEKRRKEMFYFSFFETGSGTRHGGRPGERGDGVDVSSVRSTHARPRDGTLNPADGTQHSVAGATPAIRHRRGHRRRRGS